MKLIATYPSWRKAVPETYMVEPDEADYWVEKLLASGAIFVAVRDQSACRLDLPAEMWDPKPENNL